MPIEIRSNYQFEKNEYEILRGYEDIIWYERDQYMQLVDGMWQSLRQG